MEIIRARRQFFLLLRKLLITNQENHLSPNLLLSCGVG